jgi:hypothetical protein
MQGNTNLIESLLDKFTEYGKVSYDLVKLNVVDKTSDGVSSLMTQIIVKVIFACFVLFVNLGVAFYAGELLGKVFYGFFVVAAFYGFVALVLHLFMRKWMKRVFYDYFIRQMLK